MSLLTTVPTKIAPAAAAALTVTTGSSSWASGSWVEFIASTSAPIAVVGVGLRGAGEAADVEVEIDIGVGPAGAEVVVATIRTYHKNVAVGGPASLQLPIWVGEIASGSRVSMRRRRNGTATGAVYTLHYVENPDSSQMTLAVLRSAPAAAAMVAVTPSGTAWNNSSWAELISGVSDQSAIAGLALKEGIVDEDYEIDIGGGAAGAETVLTTIRNAALGGHKKSNPMLSYVYVIGAGTRIAWRLRKGGTSTTQWFAALMYYGDVVAGEPIQKVTQLVVLVAHDEYADADPPPTADACTGGGTVASGANPSAGTSLSTATEPHVWMEITVGATTYHWSKGAINSGSTPKEPRVDTWGRIRRALSDDHGGFQAGSASITLLDADRVLRGLHATQALINKSVIIKCADATTIAANGMPEVLWRGIVRDLRPLPSLKYRLDLEDPLTLALSMNGREKMIPSTLISVSDGNADAGLREAPAPVLYGSLSDEDEDEPIGRIEAEFIGTETIPGYAVLGNLHKHLIGISPTGDEQSVFLPDPLSGTPPIRRAKVPGSLYGVAGGIYVAHHTGWPLATKYSVENGKRWAFLYIDQNHPGADLARAGIIVPTLNVCGREQTGDGNSATLDKLLRQCVHVLNNEWLNDVGDIDWPAQKTRDSYSVIDVASFEAAQTVSEGRIAGGYKGAFVLGHSHAQIALRDFLLQISSSGDFDLGVNRHGQIMATMLDRTATASGAVHFTDQLDAIDQTFTIDPKTDLIANRVKGYYRRNYVRSLQHLNPAAGERLPREPFDKTWLSYSQDEDTTEQTALGNGTPEVRTHEFTLEMVSASETADDVVSQKLALRKPSNGRAEATFAVSLQRGWNVELGQLAKVTHLEGVTATGWNGQRCQTRAHELALDEMLVYLTLRDVDDLLA